MSPISRPRICVFAKPPLAGLAKTRLAKDIGAEAAARMAKAFLADTWNAVTETPWADAILCGSEDNDDLRALACGRGDFWLQGEGDLGERLQRVCARATQNPGGVIVIGTDTPGLPLERLVQATAWLDGTNAVMGPADDGGFYLLALTHVPKGLFEHVSWGTGEVCRQMSARFAHAGVPVALLAPWFDVDNGHDLARLSALVEDGTVFAKETRAALMGTKRDIHDGALPVL